MFRIAVMVSASMVFLQLGYGKPKGNPWDALDKRIQALENNRTEVDLTTAKAYLTSGKHYEKRDATHAKRMAGLLERIIDGAERGEDLVGAQRGFFWRGYNSRFAPNPQLYSVYIPRWYDPSKRWPLIVSLHGGSSNHNVWMAMLLGNIVEVPDYRKNFRTTFRAQVHQNDAIIVAPQGMGQNHWRGAAQQDVMDVIENVHKHYNIDDDKLFINGLSNGAVASFKIGLDRAWRFAAVLPMSGIVDWEAHAAGSLSYSDPTERVVMRNESAITIAENASNTNLIYYHGRKDSGFDVSQARKMATVLKRLGIRFQYNEITRLGHHLTHVLWNDMKILSLVKKYARENRPKEVRLAAASERASRQFWVVMDDRINHIAPAHIRAKVVHRDTVEVETTNVVRFTLLLNEAPIGRRVNRIVIDGRQADLGPLAVGDRVTLSAPVSGRNWHIWTGETPLAGSRKLPCMTGPLHDLGWEAQVHVYGTRVPGDTATLRKAAELGARGWIRDVEFTQVRHPVIPDTALTPDLIRDRALVLYGNARSNAVLAEIGDRLPIRIGPDYLEMRGEHISGKGVGTKFICANPLRPDRYLVVQAGVDASAVEHAGALPMYMPDYIVFDQRFTHTSQKMALGGQPVVEMGFFTEAWQLPRKSEKNTGKRKKNST